MSRATNFFKSVVNPRVWLHLLKLSHFYNYSHVSQLPRLNRGANVTFAPNVSFRNAERITLGDGTHIGEHCIIWAGNKTGRITIGAKALFGPNVTLTASNYQIVVGAGAIMDQAKDERDIVIGPDVWLGANVVVLPGVSIGEGTVVGAGAVVTSDLPSWSIAGGIPARVIGQRPGERPTT